MIPQFPRAFWQSRISIHNFLKLQDACPAYVSAVSPFGFVGNFLWVGTVFDIITAIGIVAVWPGHFRKVIHYLFKIFSKNTV